MISREDCIEKLQSLSRERAEQILSSEFFERLEDLFMGANTKEQTFKIIISDESFKDPKSVLAMEIIRDILIILAKNGWSNLITVFTDNRNGSVGHVDLHFPIYDPSEEE